MLQIKVSGHCENRSLPHRWIGGCGWVNKTRETRQRPQRVVVTTPQGGVGLLDRAKASEGGGHCPIGG